MSGGSPTRASRPLTGKVTLIEAMSCPVVWCQKGNGSVLMWRSLLLMAERRFISGDEAGASHSGEPVVVIRNDTVVFYFSNIVHASQSPNAQQCRSRMLKTTIYIDFLFFIFCVFIYR